MSQARKKTVRIHILKQNQKEKNKKKQKKKKKNLPNDAPLWILFPLGEGISQVEETIAGHSLPWNGSAQKLRRASHEDATWRLVPDCRISAQFEQTAVTSAAWVLQNIPKTFSFSKGKERHQIYYQMNFICSFYFQQVWFCARKLSCNDCQACVTWMKRVRGIQVSLNINQTNSRTHTVSGLLVPVLVLLNDMSVIHQFTLTSLWQRDDLMGCQILTGTIYSSAFLKSKAWWMTSLIRIWLQHPAD